MLVVSFTLLPFYPWDRSSPYDVDKILPLLGLELRPLAVQPCTISALTEIKGQKKSDGTGLQSREYGRKGYARLTT
jgi:hypothetical protein